jgi:GNAT superfamily N-acetyltransferase
MGAETVSHRLVVVGDRMNKALEVRAATLDDVAGIRAVHADCDDPWAHPAECAIWVNHRILRGFLVDVAVLGRRVVGHAEWIVSGEPAPYGKHLYLGMLQVHARHQRKGVGRAMLDAGIEKAKAHACPVLRTVPEEDAKGFYRVCGFARILRVETYAATTQPEPLPAGWRHLPSVPRNVVGRLPMRWGWAQGASAHIWEIGNRWVRLVGEKQHNPCAGRTDGRAYVQLRKWGPAPEAMALAWAAPDVKWDGLVQAAMALAGPLFVETLTFTLVKHEASLLTDCCDARRTGVDEVWQRRAQ